MRLAACVLMMLPLALGAAPKSRPTAAPVRYYVQLIWGTNREKPKEARLRPVEKRLQAEFSHVFQWKNYWEVARHEAVVEKGKPATLRMSPECEVVIEFVSDKDRETRIYGKGVLVTKERGKIHCPTWSIHGGTIAEGGSWFVVVREDEPAKK